MVSFNMNLKRYVPSGETIKARATTLKAWEGEPPPPLFLPL